jgi:DUF971 family protein
VNKKLRLPVVGQPDPDRPTDVHLVGRYALGVTWADSHGSIYPFEHLRRACPCGACAALTSLTPPMAWPREIRRADDRLHLVWSDDHASVYPYPDLRQGCRCAACTGGH